LSKYPIEVEETWLGKGIEVLRNTINPGPETLEPYNFVSFRVL
jgi:hypothetical protein